MKLTENLEQFHNFGRVCGSLKQSCKYDLVAVSFSPVQDFLQFFPTIYQNCKDLPDNNNHDDVKNHHHGLEAKKKLFVEENNDNDDDEGIF